MAYALKIAKRVFKGEKIRSTGAVPGVIYGAGSTAESFAVDGIEFNKLYKKAGESSLIDVSLDGVDGGKVIVQDVQFDPVSDKIIHVDLRRIDMKKSMRAPVELKFVGESPVIKAQGGTVATSLSTVEVECLPKDLVSHIDVDLSKLNTFDDVIKIKDLVLPDGIVIISPHAEDLVVKAVRALTEDEIKAMEEASKAPVDLSKIESAKPEKVVEGEEGEAKAGADAKAPEAKKEEKKEEKKK